MSLGDYARDTVNNLKDEIKNKVKMKLKGFAIKFGIPMLFFLTLLFAIIGIFMKGADTASAADDSQMADATGDTWKQFLRYMHTLEGTKEDGDYYIIYIDSESKTRTVGYGVDLDANKENETKLLQMGYTNSDLVEGGKIKKTDVDLIESQELKDDCFSSVQNHFNATNAKEYQLYAFTSFAYNNGTGSLNKFHNGDGASKTYNQYYKIDDAEYLFHKEKVEFSSEMAKTYLAWNTGGVLTERRESEWCLFETGWYGWSIDKKGGNRKWA